MNFLHVVYNLQLSHLHEMVAVYISSNHEPTCIAIMQAKLFLSDEYMRTIVADFLRYKLCFLEDDPNFISIYVVFISTMIEKLKLISPLCQTLVITPLDSTQKRLLKKRVASSRKDVFATELRKKNKISDQEKKRLYYDKSRA